MNFNREIIAVQEGKRQIKGKEIPTCLMSSLLQPVAVIHFQLSYLGFLFYFHLPCVCSCINEAQLSVSWTNRTSPGRNYSRAQIHQSRVTLKCFQTKCQVWTNNGVRLSSIERQMLKLPRNEIKVIVHPKQINSSFHLIPITHIKFFFFFSTILN